MKKECVPDLQLSFRIALSISNAACMFAWKFAKRRFSESVISHRLLISVAACLFAWIFAKRQIFERSG